MGGKVKNRILLAAVLAWLFVPAAGMYADAAEDDQAVTGTELTAATIMYAVEGTDILREPDASAEVMGRLESGDRILALKLEGDWYRVLWDGDPCYVGKDFLAVYLVEGDWEKELSGYPEGENQSDSGEDGGGSIVSSILVIAAVLVLVLGYGVIQMGKGKKRAGRPIESDRGPGEEDDLLMLDLDEEE